MTVSDFIADACQAQRLGFKEALKTSPDERVEGWITLADATVRVRVIGNDLGREILRPFAHLQQRMAGPATAALRVDLWDVDATGIPCGAMPRTGQQNPHPASPDGRFTMHFHRNSTLAYDRIDRQLTGSFSNPDALSLYELGRPLHAPLAVWSNDRRTPLIHAGLVSREGRGLLLAGTGGSGKTTIAVVAARSGFDFVSDDMIVLESKHDGSFEGHSVFNSVYLEPSHLGRFEELTPHARQSPLAAEDKQLVLLSDVWPSRIKPSATICAVVLPILQLDRVDSSFEPQPGAKALMTLAPTSRAINKGLGRSGFNVLVNLTADIPIYTMTLGVDIDQIPKALESILREACR